MVNKTPDYLVKFCSVDTAEKILTSRALRWSAPHLFADPFEAKATQQLSFSQQDLLTATVQHTVSLLFGSDNPNGSTPILQAIRRWRSENRFDNTEEADEVLRGLLEQLVVARQEHIDQDMRQWQAYCAKVRICCFSSKVANPHAWQYLADGHRGVALSFEGGDFDTARQVKYRDSRPEILELEDQISAVMNNSAEAHSPSYSEQFLVKPEVRKNELEWRCIKEAAPDSSAPASSSDFIDVKFNPSQLIAIYLGLGTPAEAKQSIQHLAYRINPKAKIFEAQAKATGFHLRFKNLTTERQLNKKPNSHGPAAAAATKPPE